MHTIAATKKTVQNSVTRHKNNIIQIGIHGITAVLLAVACMIPHLYAAKEARASDVRIADSKGDWGYPNPFRHYPRGSGYVRMSWVFDTLVWKDRKGYIPALARTWSYDPDKSAFVFTLNPGAKWHDGQPVTAQDVAFTIAYYKKHPYQWVSADAVDQVEVVDDHTVVLYLAEPYSPFLSDIGGTMPILP
ncbi:MAG: ABC transporter substrate-binding protein, partial [Desulfotignum sp.]